jgi:hypothetical protein
METGTQIEQLEIVVHPFSVDGEITQNVNSQKVESFMNDRSHLNSK